MPASPISLEMILAAAQAGEGVNWDLKSARGGVPGSLWKTLFINRFLDSDNRLDQAYTKPEHNPPPSTFHEDRHSQIP